LRDGVGAVKIYKYILIYLFTMNDREREQEVEMQDQVRVFKALSSESRLKILRLLKEHPQCVNAIATRLDMTQPAVSQHLRLLREAGLARAEKRGNWMHYAIDHEALELHGKVMAEILGGWIKPKKAVDGTLNCPPEALKECHVRRRTKR
jgi:DNA-binding transcriptional ArsR family regulator